MNRMSNQSMRSVVCEGLESRRMLSATVVGNVLTVVGTNKSDVISVSVDAANPAMLVVDEGNGVMTPVAMAGLAGTFEQRIDFDPRQIVALELKQVV